MNDLHEPTDTFHLRFKLERGEWSREQAEANSKENWGSSDQLVFVSIRRGPVPGKGTLSMKAGGLDGYTGGQVSPVDLFKAMLCLASTVRDHPESLGWHRDICDLLLQSIRAGLGITDKV